MATRMSVFVDPFTGSYEFQGKSLTKTEFETLRAAYYPNDDFIVISFFDPTTNETDDARNEGEAGV